MTDMSMMEDAFSAILRKTTTFIFVKDRQGKYLVSSDAYAALFGFNSGSELVGKTDYDLVEKPENADHYQEIDRMVMENGVILYDLIEPNFTNAADVKWTSTSKYPVRDEQGNITGVVAEGHVIDSRYERRTAYEYDLRSVVELSADAYGALICDVTEGKVIEFHSRGKWRERIEVGMTWDDLLKLARRHIQTKTPGGAEMLAAAEYHSLMTLYRSNRKTYSFEYFWDDGEDSRWVRNDAHLFTNPDNGHLLVAFILHDVGAEHAARDELVKQANHDSLTGLLNHEGTVKRIQTALLEEKPGCLFMMDVDDFKSINDTFGHPMGDETLIAIGRIVAETFRFSDVVGRVGGDEFMVYTDEMEDLSVARAKGKELLRRIQALRLPNEQYQTTASIGIARFNGAETFEQLYSRADAMLYVSKKMGKNRVVVEGDGERYGTNLN